MTDTITKSEIGNDLLSATIGVVSFWFAGFLCWLIAPFVLMCGSLSYTLDQALVWNKESARFVPTPLFQEAEDRMLGHGESITIIKNGGFQNGIVDTRHKNISPENVLSYRSKSGGEFFDGSDPNGVPHNEGVSLSSVNVPSGGTVVIGVRGRVGAREVESNVKSDQANIGAAKVYTDGEITVMAFLVVTLGFAMAQPIKTGRRGLHLFREITKKSEDQENKMEANTPEIVVLTVRQDEYQAILERLANTKRSQFGQRKYVTGDVGRGKNRVRIMLTRTLEQGPGEAQSEAGRVISDVRPRWILVVGIGGGMPDTDYSLGDVIVSSRIHDLVVGAAKEGGVREASNQGGPVHPDVKAVLKDLPYHIGNMSNWNSPKKLKESRPELNIDRLRDEGKLYGSEDWQVKVLDSLTTCFASPEGRPAKALARPVVTSSEVIKDTALAAQWKQSSRDIAAIEMEIGGVFRAAEDHDVRVFTIRGISDIVGLGREPGWTSYACDTAAAFAVELIKLKVLV